MLLIAITFTGLFPGFAFLLPNYVQLVNGNTAMTAGLLVLPAGFAGAIFAPLGGRILDRFGARRPSLVGMSLCLFALIIFSVMSLHMHTTGRGLHPLHGRHGHLHGQCHDERPAHFATQRR